MVSSHEENIVVNHDVGDHGQHARQEEEEEEQIRRTSNNGWDSRLTVLMEKQANKTSNDLMYLHKNHGQQHHPVDNSPLLDSHETHSSQIENWYVHKLENITIASVYPFSHKVFGIVSEFLWNS